MKKIINFAALILVFITLLVQPAFAEETKTTLQFSDLDDTYWAYEGINKLVEAGIIDGYPDHTFRPDGNITRAELVKIVNQVFSYTAKQETSLFTDVTAGNWFYEYILTAQEAGYIDGYPDGTFKPDGLVTRQEFCKILAAINSFTELPYDNYPTDEVSQWAVEYVRKVVSNRIMVPDSEGKFRALENATRGEVCDALAKFLLAETPVEGEVTEPSAPSGPSGVPGSDEDNQEQPDEIMDRVIRRLEKGVIPNLTSDGQKEIVNDIIDNMNEYQADSSHDYKKAAEAAYEKYKLLSEEERTGLKSEILKQNTTADLLELKEFFFPNEEL